MFHLFLYLLLIVWVYMTAWSVLALLFKRNDLADSAWGLGFVLVAVVTYLVSPPSPAGLLLVTLTTLWGLRLFLHIFTRTIKKAEDYRYATWRKAWGPWVVPRAYFQVWMLQGALMLVVSLASIAGIATGGSIGAVAIIGALLWGLGYIFESVGDLQLRRFIANPKNKGKIMTTGLWRYTRHPNYFGEVTQWWGIYLIVLAVAPAFWWTIVSPLTITALILLVSGIPMLEKKWETHKAFQAYKKRTSAFFPLPPKR